MTKRSRGAPSSFEVMNKDAMNMSWSLDNRLKLALTALEFFDVENKHRMAQLVPEPAHRVRRGDRPPFSVLEFCEYLERTRVFERKPNYFRVQHIVNAMASHGILVQAGHSEHLPPLLTERYMYFRGMFGEHFRGNLWLTPALGPELLYREARPGVVHITGTKGGDAVGATGVIVHRHYVVICRHVVEGVDLDACQSFLGKACAVDADRVRRHATEDIALIRVDATLTPLHRAVFRQPIVGQAVHTMGYPRLPNTRDATLTMQSGTVTNERVTNLDGQSLFLYSAISRPGNSGGPVMSEDGFVIGLATEDHVASYSSDERFAPHYAAVPADVVVETVEELAPEIELVVGKFE